MLLPPVLALLGFVLSLQAWAGIRAARAVIGRWHAKQEELLARVPDLSPYRSGASDERLRQGVLFATRAPWIFGPAWCYFGALPVWLHTVG